MRRIVGNCLIAPVVDDLRDSLEPLQLGVGTKAGAEAMVHAVRQWTQRNTEETNKCLVMLDLRNAFNCVDRAAFLEAIRIFSPGLAPWADVCYSEASWLLFGDKKLKRCRGIQQGDPLGPALFSLAIHSRIVAAKESVNQVYPGELDICIFLSR